MSDLHQQLAAVEEEVRDLTVQLQEEVASPESNNGNVIIIDCLPVVPTEQYDSLKKFLFKVLSSAGKFYEETFYMPIHQNNTLGIAIVEFHTAAEANSAIAQLNGLKVKNAGKLKANHYSDLAALANLSEEYVPPAQLDINTRENLHSWLLDPRPIDQYTVRYADETEIYWNELGRKPEPIYKRKKWTDSYVVWSPMGTYLATFHPQGIILWGGESWKRIVRLSHQNVKLIEFSPKENFLITFSPTMLENDNPKDPQCIIVWDVRTGKKLRGFLGTQQPLWPVFKWSHDDKYFARMIPNAISIYEAPSMNMLDNKSLKIDEIKDFSWSPTDSLISCWVPESGNTPARVMLIDVPSKKERRSYPMYNVTDCKMHWQNNGDYLCVKVDRHGKNKAQFTNFEIFRLRGKNVPVESIEMKQSVIAFAWEPGNTKFAVVHVPPGSTQRPDVSFYDMGKDGAPKLLKTLEKRTVSHIFWSPAGHFIVLAGLGGTLDGHLEFYNVDDLETMSMEDHSNATDVAWDPTGRFVTTSVISWTTQMDNGYNIWSFQGTLVHKVQKDMFYQFLWRPRPPSLLSAEKEQYIRKNLSEYSARIRKKEIEERNKILKEIEDKRNQTRQEFYSWLKDKKQQYEATRERRRQLWRGAASDEDDDWEEVSQLVEEVISVDEEIV